MITEVALHPKWISSSNTEGFGCHTEFMRKSDVLNTPEGDGQVVFFTCSGRGSEKIVIHNGRATGELPIRNIFDNFGWFKGSSLSLNFLLQSEPKIGKSRSGDMPAVIAVFENLEFSKILTVFTILVDNLTPELSNTYGLWSEESDSYAASCQRECLHNNPQKWIELARVVRKTNLTNYDYEALNQSQESIDESVLRFRQKFLGNFCGSLPFSPSGSPLFRGIYACSASYIEIHKGFGFLGRTATIRSKADIYVNVSNKTELTQDNHLVAQAIGRRLGASHAELYQAKLGERIYDTTATDFNVNIGSFEMKVSNISEDGGGSASFGIYSESDGAKVSRDADDFSSNGVYICGDIFK